MNDNIEVEFPLLRDVVYLDHAAATLYAKSQLVSYMQDLSSHIYGNPHSRSQSSQLTSEVIENVRERILHHFGTSSETHSVIFTANCTAAIKLVAETFKWNSIPAGKIIPPMRDVSKSQKAIFLYLENSHTSVVGMREYASKHGADFSCIAEKEVESLLENSQVLENDVDHELPHCLFAYPAQCNFSGRKFPQNWSNSLKRNKYANFSGRCGKWCVLLDAASYVMTSKLDLSLCSADFVPVSFYKMFGFPTGIGALIIRNESVAYLQKTFFGGGTVQAYLSTEHFHVPKVNIHEWFEDGTLPFLDVIAIRHGFDTLQGLAGGISQISQHTFALARYVHHELASYHHGDGKPVAKLYHDNGFEDIRVQGAIVNFNILRRNGDYVGYSEVDKLANLYNIQLRTGCFCNTGACQKFLGLTSEKVKKNFEAGHSCGDDQDLIDGRPTGSIRISFGYMSRWKDAKRFLQFIRDCFMSTESAQVEKTLLKINSNNVGLFHQKDKFTLSQFHGCVESQDRIEATKNVCNRQIHSPDSEYQKPVETGMGQYIQDGLVDTVSECQEPVKTGTTLFLHKMFLYPVKSCAAMEVTEWEIGARGFLYDREWMIVNENGVALTQKRNASLCHIKPDIDLKKNSLILSAKGKTPFTVPLEIEDSSSVSSANVRVCMNRVQGIDCGQAASDWLSNVIGQRCRLIKQNHQFKRLAKHKGEAVEVSFANESQFLLLNKCSVNHLLKCIQQRDVKEQNTDSEMDLDNLIGRFRANFVISGWEAFEEDGWKEIYINDMKFKVVGPCTRCQMVCVDQETGVRGKEPLTILSSLRGTKLSFGVYLHQLTNKEFSGTLSISDPVRVVMTEDN